MSCTLRSVTERWPQLLPHHGRFDYAPITRRPDYAWPNGARLAVYLGFNLEHFAFGDGLGARIGPPSAEPDVLNHGWREYGNRVGAWRCLELFDQLGLKTGALINTALYDHCPELVAACRSALLWPWPINSSPRATQAATSSGQWS